MTDQKLRVIYKKLDKDLQDCQMLAPEEAKKVKPLMQKMRKSSRRTKMERKQYPTSNGRLENNVDKNDGDKRPITKTPLRHLINQMLNARARMKAVKLQLAAWKNADKETGEPIPSIKAEAYLNRG